MKHLLSLVLLLALSGVMGAQTLIKGIVVDTEDHPMPGVNIRLEQAGSPRGGASTDAHGEFHFHASRVGQYQLTFSFVGYTTKVLRLEVKDSRPIDLGRIVLEESQELLQAVEIVGRLRRDYNSDYSFSATKVAVKNKDLPQIVTSITKELIHDRQAYQLSEAVKGASSVTQVGFYNHFNIRGVTQNQQGQVLNGMRTNQYYFLQPLTQHIERVEVIKGPGSITLSSTDPGGTVNMVTKKPLSETRREVNVGVGSFSTVRAGLDFTGPINQDKTLLYRLNVALQEAKSYRDLVRNDGLLIVPSLSYIPNDRTAINIELIYSDSQGNLDRGQPIFGKVTSRADLYSTPISTNLAAVGDHFRSKELIATTSLTHRLSDRLTFNAQYMKQTWQEDLQEHRTHTLVKDVDGKTIPNLILMRYQDRRQFWNTDNLNAYLSYDWKLGRAKNTLVVGYDLARLDKIKGNSQNGARGYVAGETISYKGTTIPKPMVGFFDTSDPKPNVGNPNAYTLTPYIIPAQLITTHGLYVQSLTQWGGLTALLSLRHERFIDELNPGASGERIDRNSVWLPRIGLSYALSKEWSVYATYLEGFQPQAHAEGMMAYPAYDGSMSSGGRSLSEFKPFESSLIEAGVKAELMGGRIKSTLSLFQIDQDNILVQVEDPNAPDGYSYVQRGSDRSRGFEWELSGHILPRLQVSAAYSYIDAYIKSDPRPDQVGKRKEASPKHSASLWAKYALPEASLLGGLSVGLGVQYSGDKLGWYDRELTIPGYTVLDGVLFYQPKGSRLELSLKAGNLLNKVYWTGAINAQRMFPGTPRHFILSTTYRF